jgi:hypothetical protein
MERGKIGGNKQTSDSIFFSVALICYSSRFPLIFRGRMVQAIGIARGERGRKDPPAQYVFVFYELDGIVR